MRSNVATRALVSATAVVGIAAASLAGASGSFAASAPITNPAANSTAAVPLAVHNLGLTTAQAKKVQSWLKTDWDYTGPIDGLLGSGSWMAMQRYLKEYWHYTRGIDGIPGSETVKALQRCLKEYYGYTGKIDGTPGSGTEAAFARLADSL